MKNLIIVKLIWLLFFPVLFSFSSCVKEEPFPNGSNTFTWKLNGVSYRAQTDDWKKSATNAGFIADTLGVSGTNTIGSYHSVGFRIENFSGTGTYLLNTQDDNYGRYHGSSTLHSYTDASHTGEVQITHYIPEKGIIAGTFSFTTIDSNTGKTYRITDGKFDMTYTRE